MDDQELPDQPREVTPAAKPAEPAGRRSSPWLFLAALVALYAWLLARYGLQSVIEETKIWGLVALGLGFVIFIHELGHFLVAKWCDVHVETFSIGFGPAIPGCQFRWGETTYMLAWFPLGGYVKMVGEGTENDEEEDDPRSFRKKPVWQRMAIISAGVIMNVILGFVCFILVYMTAGVKRPTAIVGQVVAGTPAWKEGLQSGHQIYRIGNIEDPYFDDLQVAVVLSGRDAKLPLVYGWPGRQPIETVIEPRRDEDDDKPVIGVRPAESLTLAEKRQLRERKAPVSIGSAAAAAQPPFTFGDRIIATTDPARPGEVTPLPPDPRRPGSDARDFFEFQKRMRLLAGQPVVIRVLRTPSEGGPPTEVDIRVPPEFHRTLGTRMRMGKIAAVRPDSSGRMPDLQIGDRITQVEVTDADGRTIRWTTSRPATPAADVIEDDLDPLKLPYELARWAASLPPDRPKVVTLTVLRPNPVTHKENEPVTVRQTWDAGRPHDDAAPLGLHAPLPIAGLNIAYRVENTIEAVKPNSPAAKARLLSTEEPFPLQPGDVIKAVRFYHAKPTGEAEEPAKRWTRLDETADPKRRRDADQWAYVAHVMQLVDGKRMDLRLERGNEAVEVSLEMVADPTWPLDDRGLVFQVDRRVQRAEGVFQAIGMGLTRTATSIQLIYRHLAAALTRRVSLNNFGGPIMIASLAYDSATMDLASFIFFIGFISVNLAVVNFLPIPVLDGGHMLFLVYEKLRGRPPSEQVLRYATVVGLVVILSLMALVIFLDVRRQWF
ncbi:MAG: site-2 protease family protein [Gemmataceae bacterium]|nr:site-2 protease family protein [Gemmataceae bacterium]MDW8264684.1 site-2 protease family protein [Gemmataceae bacterium]